MMSEYIEQSLSPLWEERQAVENPDFEPTGLAGYQEDIDVAITTELTPEDQILIKYNLTDDKVEVYNPIN